MLSSKKYEPCVLEEEEQSHEWQIDGFLKKKESRRDQLAIIADWPLRKKEKIEKRSEKEHTEKIHKVEKKTPTGTQTLQFVTEEDRSRRSLSLR